MLREKSNKKAKQEIKSHLMILHDACFSNELLKYTQLLLEIIAVSHKGTPKQSKSAQDEPLLSL